MCYSKTEAEDCEDADSDNVFLGSTCYTESDFNVSRDLNYTCNYYDKEDCTTYEKAASQGDILDNYTTACDYEGYIRDRYCDRTGASEEYFK